MTNTLTLEETADELRYSGAGATLIVKKDDAQLDVRQITPNAVGGTWQNLRDRLAPMVVQ